MVRPTKNLRGNLFNFLDVLMQGFGNTNRPTNILSLNSRHVDAVNIGFTTTISDGNPRRSFTNLKVEIDAPKLLPTPKTVGDVLV